MDTWNEVTQIKPLSFPPCSKLIHRVSGPCHPHTQFPSKPQKQCFQDLFNVSHASTNTLKTCSCGFWKPKDGFSNKMKNFKTSGDKSIVEHFLLLRIRYLILFYWGGTMIFPLPETGVLGGHSSLIMKSGSVFTKWH